MVAEHVGRDRLVEAPDEDAGVLALLGRLRGARDERAVGQRGGPRGLLVVPVLAGRRDRAPDRPVPDVVAVHLHRGPVSLGGVGELDEAEPLGRPAPQVHHQLGREHRPVLGREQIVQLRLRDAVVQVPDEDGRVGAAPRLLRHSLRPPVTAAPAQRERQRRAGHRPLRERRQHALRVRVRLELQETVPRARPRRPVPHQLHLEPLPALAEQRRHECLAPLALYLAHPQRLDVLEPRLRR
mmetsp:Transcript_17271/g.53955  ORF Transcript_17271/g.53955 Transcript_17271/m.53955 type:complete len:240 (+) Transcript_17271:908-1627(+)